MKKIVLSFIIISFYFGVQAQTAVSYPEVGKPCPDFLIKNIAYYGKQQARPKDFLGKWLVLDFYDKTCGSCIAAFPRYNEHQKTFGDKLQILLIGREDPENKIRGIYAKYRRQENLILPCAFDSSVFRRLDINNSPFAIIIDPAGVVQYITTFISTKDLEEMLAGNHPVLRKRYREHEMIPAKYAFDRKYPLLVNENGGNDKAFTYRSVLTGFDPKTQDWTGSGPIVYPAKWAKEYNYTFQGLGKSLNDLYRVAYIGEEGGVGFHDSLYSRLWPENVLEVSNPSDFDANVETTGKNTYCYSLSVPPSKYNRTNMMRIMQNDLKNYFGYDVCIETRQMPYWRLVATEKAKIQLRTKGGVPFVTPGSHEYNDSIIVIRNMPVSSLFDRIPLVNMYSEPFIDETGIEGNIDITLQWGVVPMIDRTRGYLQANGLDLVLGKKEMKVLVIRDPKPEETKE